MAPQLRVLLTTVLLTVLAATLVALASLSGFVTRLESSLHDQRVRSGLATRPPVTTTCWSN